MDQNDNPYTILELTPGATEADIKKSYRQFARKYHPDKQKTDEERQVATATFAKISDAYDLLLDPVRRYDWRQKYESSQGRLSSSSAASMATPTPRSSRPTTTVRSSGKGTVRSRTPPPGSTNERSLSPIPANTNRGSFGGPPGAAKPRPSSLGPGPRAFRGSTGSSMPSPSAHLKKGTAESVLRNSAGPSMGAPSPSAGPPRRNVVNDIPRRSMVPGKSPARAQSPVPGRKKGRDSSIPRPTSDPNIDFKQQAGTQQRFKQKKPMSANLDGRSEHSGGMRRVTTLGGGLDAASLHSVKARKMRSSGGGESLSPMRRVGTANGSLDAPSIHSVKGRKMRSSGGRESLSPMRPVSTANGSLDAAAMNNVKSRKPRSSGSRESISPKPPAQRRHSPSSLSSLDENKPVKNSKSEPGGLNLRKKKKSLLSGINLGGSSSNTPNVDQTSDGHMKNATFDSPSATSIKSAKSFLSKGLLKMNPLTGRA